VARINIDGAIADALADRGHHPHPMQKPATCRPRPYWGRIRCWRPGGSVS